MLKPLESPRRFCNFSSLLFVNFPDLLFLGNAFIGVLENLGKDVLYYNNSAIDF